MRDEQEQGTPVWHAIVGEGWRPVRIGEETRSGDEALTAGGWAEVNDSGSFVYKRFMMPRRRRKHQVLIEVSSEQDGMPFRWECFAKPGDCFQLGDSGRLIPIDKPAEGQVER